jgi:gliding motility-associated-like protein
MTSVGSCAAPVGSNAIAMAVLASPGVKVRPADTVIAYGESVNLESVITGPVVDYQWTPAVGLSNASVADPVAKPAETTVYRLTVRSGDGCLALDSALVVVYRRFFLPNAFTPNGNGKNDLFRIPPGVGVGLIRFEVYDRGGVQVFFSSDASRGWDGTVGGVPQPAGVYVWVVAYTDLLTEKRLQAEGTVLLVR